MMSNRNDKARLLISQRGLRLLRFLLSPLTGIALFASGGRLDLLEKIPSERTWHASMGTFVILTSLVAGVAAFATAGFVTEGQVTLGGPQIAFGFLWAILIFVFDRLIVKLPISPVKFSPRVVGMLWNPSADIRWYVEESQGKPTEITTGRWTTLPRAIVSLIPRVVVAVCASYIFAETLLFVYFQDDIQPRVAVIASSQREEQMELERSVYDEEVASLNTQRDVILAAIDTEVPTLVDMKNEYSTLLGEIEDLNYDYGQVEYLRGWEGQGTIQTVTLSDGTILSSSSDNGVGTRYDSLTSRMSRLSSDRLLVEEQVADLLLEIQGRESLLSQNPGVIEVDNKLSELEVNAPSELDINAIQGIGIRRQALHEYANDMNPLTVAYDEPPSCDGNVWCSISRAVLPPTAVGTMVSTVMFMLLSIEIMPIIAKLAYVLRKRRPYDEMVAAEELMRSAKTLTEISSYLAAYGAAIEETGRYRRATRTAEAAEYVVERSRAQNDDSPHWSRLREWLESLRQSFVPPKNEPVRLPPVKKE